MNRKAAEKATSSDILQKIPDAEKKDADYVPAEDSDSSQCSEDDNLAAFNRNNINVSKWLVVDYFNYWVLTR